MEVDDATLLRRYAENDAQDAFSEFVRRHMDLVYSAALRRVGFDAHSARDVAQDVFVLVARNARGLATHTALVAWLHSATRNTALNHLRTHQRRTGRETTFVNEHAGNNPDADARAWDELAPLLDDALDRLKGPEKQALILRFFQQRSFADIGDILGLREDAARMRVERAVVKLRTHLERRGIRSTAAALGGALLTHGVSAAPAGFAQAAAQLAMRAGTSGGAGLLLWWTKTQLAAFATACAALVVATFFAAQNVRAYRNTITPRSEIEQNAKAVTKDIPGHRQAGTRPEAIPAIQKSVDEDVPTPTPTHAVVPGYAAGGRRAHVAATYSALYDKLGMTAEQINAFEVLNVQSPGPALWVYGRKSEAADSSTVAPGAAVVLAEERERSVAKLLGPDKYAEYRDYVRTVPAREVVVQLAGAVYLVDPLTREKGEALTLLLAQHSPSFTSGGAVNMLSLSWNVALDQAKTVLTPRQVHALEDIQRRLQLEHQITLRADGLSASPR